jgi:hypothetical protein
VSTQATDGKDALRLSVCGASLDHDYGNSEDIRSEAADIKDNPHLIYVRAVHERNFGPTGENPSPKNSQKDSIVATLPVAR